MVQAETATALPQKAEARDGWWVAGAVVSGLALGLSLPTPITTTLMGTVITQPWD